MFANRIVRFVALIWFCSWTPGSVSTAEAGVYNYYDVMIGGRAAQMGGAFTALSDDATAAYFNPAGLAQISTPSFSVSANGLDIQTYTISDRLFGKDVVFRSSTFYPTAWSVVRSLGEHRLAFSAIVPSNLDIASTTQFDDIVFQGQTFDTGYLDSRIKDRVYLVGPSLAYRLNPAWMIGGTAYYWYGEALSETTAFFGGGGTQSQTGLFNRSRLLTQGFLGQAGFLYHPSDQYSIGLTLRSPAFLQQDAEIQDQRYTFDAPTSQFVNSFSQSRNSQSARRPPGVILGLAVRPRPARTLSMDLSYYAASDYHARSGGILIEPVWNAAVGFEEMIRPQISFRSGLYTNRSAAPELNGRPTAQDDHLDYYGATLGLGFADLHSTFETGIRYAWG
ncbi:MAG: outer membrane protein transport protein, partial [Nitrospirae bacterium]|nr:outer membrane protein transport protein [Nitrospirota bacterium]